MEETRKITTNAKMTREFAESEFNRWAEIKKLRPKAIERNNEHQDAKEAMIDAIEDGTLAIAEDGKITQKLNFPISTDHNELVFKTRLIAAEMSALDRKKDGAGKSRMLIYKLTDIQETLIAKMDSNDLALSQAIAGFYYLV